ncbi:hypothetical protein SCALM49S_04760 [Streptomyces californicus]
MLPSPQMLLAHVLVALATGWLLRRRGEIALFALARLSAHGAQALAAGPGCGPCGPRSPSSAHCGPVSGVRSRPGRACRAPSTTSPCRRPGTLLQHLVIRRGPPAPYALAA